MIQIHCCMSLLLLRHFESPNYDRPCTIVSSSSFAGRIPTNSCDDSSFSSRTLTEQESEVDSNDDSMLMVSPNFWVAAQASLAADRIDVRLRLTKPIGGEDKKFPLALTSAFLRAGSRRRLPRHHGGCEWWKCSQSSGGGDEFNPFQYTVSQRQSQLVCVVKVNVIELVEVNLFISSICRMTHCIYWSWSSETLEWHWYQNHH